LLDKITKIITTTNRRDINNNNNKIIIITSATIIIKKFWRFALLIISGSNPVVANMIATGGFHNR
jgi:hypothetical protein